MSVSITTSSEFSARRRKWDSEAISDVRVATSSSILRRPMMSVLARPELSRVARVDLDIQ